MEKYGFSGKDGNLRKKTEMCRKVEKRECYNDGRELCKLVDKGGDKSTELNNGPDNTKAINENAITKETEKKQMCVLVDKNRNAEMCKIVNKDDTSTALIINKVNTQTGSNLQEVLTKNISEAWNSNTIGNLVYKGVNIANFTISIIKMYTLYDEDMETVHDALYDIECHVKGERGVESYPFKKYNKNELLSGNFVDKIPNIIMNVSRTEYNKVYQKYINLLISKHKGTVIKVIENSGWINYMNKWMYITNTGCIGDYDEQIISRDNFAIKPSSWVNTVKEFKDMRGVLKEKGQMDVILLYLLSQTMHSLFNAKGVDLKHILFIVGPRGSRKTALSLCFTQLINKKTPKYNFQATLSGIHFGLKENKDRVMLIDDLAPSLDTSSRKEREKKLESIIRLFGDSTERVINTCFMQNNSDKIDYSVKGGAVITGEYFYGTGAESSVARAVVIEIEDNSVALDKLRYYQERTEILESLVYEFIEFVYKNQQEVLDIISTKTDEYRKYAYINSGKFSNGRYWEYFGQYMATAEILALLFTKWKGINTEDACLLMESLRKGVLNVLERNDNAMRTENPANIIINSIVDLLESNKFCKWGEAISENTPLVLGEDAIYFKQDNLLDIVKAYTRKNGINFMLMSSTEIAKLLKNNGYCEEYSEGNQKRYSKKYKGYGNERLMCIKREKIHNFLSDLHLN